MLKKIGVFTTPAGVTRFGEYSVRDTRDSAGENSPAEWSLIEHEALVCFVLTTPEQGAPVIGSFVSGSEGLKWDLSINIKKDVRMLAMWAGSDVSRTGCHGTQHYAYLATDLRGCEATQMASRVKNGTIGMEWITSPSQKNPIKFPERGTLNLFEVELIYKPQSYGRYGSGRTDRGKPLSFSEQSKASVKIANNEFVVGEEFDLLKVVTIIRNNIAECSDGLEEVLLIAEHCIAVANNTVKSLYDFYCAKEMVEVSLLCADYLARKKEENMDADFGVLFDLNGYFRRMGNSGNCDLWVITPDGQVREPDELVRRKSYPEGTKRWHRVERDELVITWQPGKEVVAHAPVHGVTPAQISAVLEIERELGTLDGSFGLDPVLNAEYARRMGEIRGACRKEGVILPVEAEYKWFASASGHMIDDWKKNILYHLGDTECSARTAYLQHKVPCAGGMLEFVAFNKFGQMNVAVRRRECVADEIEVGEEIQPTEAKPATQEGLASLLSKFGK